MVKEHSGPAQAGPIMKSAKPERNALIIKDYKLGMTGPQLAEKYGVCHQRIYQLLKREFKR